MRFASATSRPRRECSIGCRGTHEVRTTALERRAQPFAEFRAGHRQYLSEPLESEHVHQRRFEASGHQRLGEAHHFGRSFGEACGLCEAGRLDLIVRHHLRDQPEVERFLRRERGAAEEEVLRAGHADEPRQVVHGTDVRHHSQSEEPGHELRTLAGDHDVPGEREPHAAAHRMSPHAHDDRLVERDERDEPAAQGAETPMHGPRVSTRSAASSDRHRSRRSAPRP